MDYERGLTALKTLAQGRDWLQDFTLFEARLRENLTKERRFGSSESLRSDRAQIVDALNALALAKVGQSFNDLCLTPTPTAPPPAGGSVTAAPRGVAIGGNVSGSTIITGDGNVVYPGGSAPPVATPAGDRETLQRALAMARRALYILEEQAAGYTSLTIPVHLMLELEEKRKEVAGLEARLRGMRE